MVNKTLSGVFVFLSFSTLIFGQVNVGYPSSYMVIQRNTQNEGVVYITGTLSQLADRVEARLLKIQGEPGESQENWIVLDNTVGGGAFSGEMIAKGGRYNLEVRAVKNGQPLGSSSFVEKVGVGEVFLIVGHSNAQGVTAGLPAQSSLVISMDPNVDEQKNTQYLETADPAFLPKDFNPLASGRGISPFSGNPWFWGQFGDMAVQKLGVPVLIYQAAFGGSNMLQTKKSAFGESFEHGFIKSSIRMPYINIENTLFHLVPVTGLRAVLSAHGINDAGSTENEFYDNHKLVIEFSRATDKFRNLAWMIANSCYNDGVIQHLHSAQERLMLLENVFRGADLNSIDNSGRLDKLHFSELGQELAADLWSDVVSGVDFLRDSRPIMPDRPQEPQGTLPVVLAEFDAGVGEDGDIQVTWATTSEKDNSHFEIQYSYDAREFMTAGEVEGAVNYSGLKKYSYSVPEPLYEGNVYFRLKQVDLDGTFEFSGIVSVEIRNRYPHVFFPNPSPGIFEFRSSGARVPRMIRVYDLMGALLLEARDTSRINLSSLPAASYIAVVESSDGVKTVRKIFKS